MVGSSKPRCVVPSCSRNPGETGDAGDGDEATATDAVGSHTT